MNQKPEQIDLRDEKITQAEQTLRLLAELPAPAELTDRVHARVRRGLAEERATQERRSFWSLWFPNLAQTRRFQFAGAAALAIVVGSGCGAYYMYYGQAQAGSGNAVVAPAPQVGNASSGGLSTAGAVRTPPTLKPIKVPPAPKKKPSASHAKPAPRVNAVQGDAPQGAVPAAPKP